MAVRAETNVEPFSRSCTRRVHRRADESAESFVRTWIRISQALETGYDDSIVLRHHKHSTEVELDQVGEESYGDQLPSRQVRNRRDTLRNEPETRRIRRIVGPRESVVFCGRACVGRLRRISFLFSAFRKLAPPSVILLPEPAADCTERETGNSAKQPGDCDQREEVPKPANELAALELRAEKLPCERRRADEPEKERTIRRNVLDGGATELIELGLNDSSRECATPFSAISDVPRCTL